MIRGAFLFAVALLTPQPVVAATITEVHYVMGTYFRITAEPNDGAHARAALRRCFMTARHLDELFSRYDPASELSRLNAAAEGSAVTVSTEMAALLRRALELQSATDGAFDVSVGALTGLWRRASEWPAPAMIDAARQASGAGAIALTGTTLIRRPGVLIDLDGVAKGWAVDRCVSQLRADGIERALLSLGESSLYGIGTPSGTPGWPVALRSLDSEHEIGRLTLRDQAMSVSAVFGHVRRVGSQQIGHIVDPRSGQPVSVPAMAVVVAASATDAEAFSKALLIRPDSGRLLPPSTDTVTGTLLITSTGVRRSGSIAFGGFSKAQWIAGAAEPLR